MANKPFVSQDGYSIGDTPVNIILANGDITTTRITLSNDATSTSGAVVLTGDPNPISGNVGVLQIGPPLGFDDTDIVVSMSHSANGYTQVILQNPDPGTLASADFVVNNDRSTGAGIYGDFGINSSNYAGGGAFGIADGVYLLASNATMSVGTLTEHPLNLATNNVTRMTVASISGNITVTGNLAVGNLDMTAKANLGAVGNVAITGGSANYTLETNGSGVLSWVAPVTASSLSGTTLNSSIVTSSLTTVGTLGSLTVTGNISSGNANLGNLAKANFFQGDGGLLSNITGSSGAFIANGTSNVTIATSGGNVTTSVGASANVLVITTTGANITGTANVSGNANVGNLGTGGLIVATGNVSGGNLTTGGQVVATGNITGGNLIGPHANGNSNVNIATANGNITLSAVGNTIMTVTGTGANITGTFNVTGNANVGNLGTGGLVVATGNVTGGNLTTGGALAVTGNANVGNLGTAGLVVATGNVTGGNLVTGGVANVGGNIIGGASAIIANVVYVGTGANGTSLTTPVFVGRDDGALYVQAALFNANAAGSSDWVAYGNNGNDVAGWADMGFTSSTFSDANYTITKPNDGYFIVQAVNGAGLGGNLVLATGDQGANNDIVFATGGFLTANEKMRYIHAAGQFDIQPTTVSSSTITGALRVRGGTGIAGNLYVGGLINGAANITGANLTTGGVVAATGNVSGGNLTTGGQVVATGNITGGNLMGIFANGTSNVRIPAVNGNVNISAAGNANVVVVTGTGANITGELTVTGNATVGNLISGFGTGGNITGANLVSANYFTGTLTTAAQPNITSVGSLTSLTVVNDLTGNTAHFNGAAYSNASITTALQLTTKAYVDQASSTGLQIHTPVLVEFESAITGTYTQGGTTPTVTTIATGNVLSTSSTHSLSVNDIIVFGSSTNGLVAGTAYFVLATPAANQLTLTLVYDGTSEVTGLTNGTGLTITSRANSGVGAKITNAGTQAALVIDGVTMAATNRVLVVNQANTTWHGVYSVTNIGSGATNWELTRATDADKYVPKSTAGLASGSYFFITGGSAAGESYVLTSPTSTIIFGTTSITMTLFAAAISYSGTSPIVVSGHTISLANTTGSTDVVVLGTSPNLITPNIGDATGNSLTLTGNGNISANSIALSGLVTVNGNLTANSNVSFTGANVSLGSNANLKITGGSSSQYLQTDGAGNLSWQTVAAGVQAIIANGTSNVNIPAVNGNVNISSAGNANIVVVTGTGANVAGTLNTTGNVTGGNLLTAGSVTASTLISNVAVGTAPFTVTSTTTVANLSVASATTAGTVTAASQGNITSVGTLASLIVSGNANVGNLNATGQLVSTVATSTAPLVVTSTTQVANLNVATAGVAGTVTTNAQPNITSVGLLSALTVGNATANTIFGNGIFTSTGNANVGNLGAAQVLATANITAPRFISNIAIGTAPFTVTSTTVVANLNSATAGTAGTVTTNAQPNITSVGLLSALTVGNATANTIFGNGIFTATGNANVGNIGATNHVGTTVNVTGQIITTVTTSTAPFVVNSTTQVANLNVATAGTAGSATTAGTVTTNAQPNITSVGLLSALTVGNATANTVFGNGTIVTSGTGGNISGANVISGNTINVTGQLISTVATSTAPLVVTSTTIVPNLYVAHANVAEMLNLSTGTTGNYYFTMASATSGNVALVGNANILANLTSGILYATKFFGDGGLLSNITATGGASITNGTSNVVAAASGNVTTSVAGNANIIVATGTGANVNGYLTVSGVTTLGAVANVKITGGTSGYVLRTDGAANLTWVAQGGGGGGVTLGAVVAQSLGMALP